MDELNEATPRAWSRVHRAGAAGIGRPRHWRLMAPLGLKKL